MKPLLRVHFWTGFLGIIAFISTDQYMHHVHDHLEGMADGQRMLFRSAHIYLLLTAILNLAMGIYLQPASGRLRIVLQYVVSTVVLLSPWVMLAGFFIESQDDSLSRPIIRIGLYALFGIAVVLIVQNLRRQK